MGKGDFMSPKNIANRIKAKGLQKVRWYCQMCNKQCRDENGFKCHTMSEGHIRMMAIFAENPDSFMDDFSTNFEKGYLEILARRYGARRVHANVVYNEYIQDKGHVHMNSTIWPTLTDFVKYLGRMGRCHIEETERGWFVTYITRDPEVLRRMEETERRKQKDVDDETRHEAELDVMVATAKSMGERAGGGEADGRVAYTGLVRGEGMGKIKLLLPSGKGALKPATHSVRSVLAPEEEGDEGSEASTEEDTHGGMSGDDDEDEREEAENVRFSAGAGPGPGDVGYEEFQKQTHSKNGISAGAGAGVAPKRSRLAAFTEEEEEEGMSGGTHTSTHTLTSDSTISSAPAPAPAPAAKRARGDDEAASTRAGSDGGGGSTGSIPPPASGSRREGGVSRFDSAVAGVRTSTSAPSHRFAPQAPPATRREDWLHVGIVVKILNKQVADGAMYKQKGTVTEVRDTFVAVINVHSNNATLMVDQADCETVLPSVGGTLLVVNGAHRGEQADLLELHVDKYCATVRLEKGPHRGMILPNVEYEDICKLDAKYCTSRR